jgi:hypothetical protein
VRWLSTSLFEGEVWKQEIEHLGFKAQYSNIYKEYRLLKFCYVPATSGTSSKAFFFAAATNSSNETNKAGSTSQ